MLTNMTSNSDELLETILQQMLSNLQSNFEEDNSDDNEIDKVLIFKDLNNQLWQISKFNDEEKIENF